MNLTKFEERDKIMNEGIMYTNIVPLQGNHRGRPGLHGLAWSLAI